MTTARAGRVLVATVALATLALVGCSSSSTGSAPEPTDTTATVTRTPAALVAPTPAELGIEACDGARAPVYVERTAYQRGTTTSGLLPPPDTTADASLDPPSDRTLSLSARWFSGPRNPSDDSGVITVAHPTGDPTVLGGKGMVVGFPGGRSWIGDLDGDGVDEVLVISTRPGGGTSASDGGMPVVIVTGTVAPGLQDPFAVGVTLPIDGAQGQGAFGVGDIDGDGADDVMMPDPSELSSPPVIVSGRDLMAAGPGADLGEVPTPIATVSPSWFGPTSVGGLLTLAPDTTPIAGQVTADGVSLTTDPATLLRTDDQFAATAGPRTLSAYRSGGHRIVTLSSGADRSGVTLTQMWDLDGVCPD